MVSLTRSKAVAQLGERLVGQLDADDDLLASWMAHYVAQRIESAEKAPADAKAEAQDACASAILELWRYRNALPSHLRPLGELEPVLRTIASLDVDRTEHHYFRQALDEAAGTVVEEDAKQWLELAIGIDYTARLLIRSALKAAAHRAASKAALWVELALQAGASEGPETAVVEFILGDDGERDEDKESQRAALGGRLSQLESFVSFATSLVEDLRAQLRGSLGPGGTPQDGGDRIPEDR